MTWLLAIALALAAFAAAVLAFRVARTGWTAIAAALALGLAGYAMQANPGMPGAPAKVTAEDGDAQWALVDERKEMLAEDQLSKSSTLIVADAYARRGRFIDAAEILRGEVARNPRDTEAWLALGNALVEHAGGALTEPALLAYRRADALSPGGTATGYFLGLALIRQGRLGEAQTLWRSTLAAAPAGAAGRDILALRLSRLDTLLAPSAAPAVVPN